MQIVVTFEGLGEMRRFARELAGGSVGMAAVQQAAGAVAADAVQETEAQMEVEEVKTSADPVSAVEDTADTDDKAYTLEDVRAALAALNKSGKKAEVQTLINSFGADKLSGIPAEKYGELMAKAGEL